MRRRSQLAGTSTRKGVGRGASAPALRAEHFGYLTQAGSSRSIRCCKTNHRSTPRKGFRSWGCGCSSSPSHRRRPTSGSPSRCPNIQRGTTATQSKFNGGSKAIKARDASSQVRVHCATMLPAGDINAPASRQGRHRSTLRGSWGSTGLPAARSRPGSCWEPLRRPGGRWRPRCSIR